MKALKKYFFETAIPFLIWLGIIIFAFWLEFSGSNRSSKKAAIEPICSSQLPSELAQCLAANQQYKTGNTNERKQKKTPSTAKIRAVSKVI